MYAWFLVFFSEALTARGAAVGSAAAYATFAVIAMGGLGSWVGGILGDRWGRTKTTALMMIVSASCCLLIGLLFGSSAWLVLLVSLVWGATIISPLLPHRDSVIRDVAHKRRRTPLPRIRTNKRQEVGPERCAPALGINESPTRR
jgi:MFS family permease